MDNAPKNLTRRFWALLILLLATVTLNAQGALARSFPSELKVGINIAIPNLLSFQEGRLSGTEAHRYMCVLQNLPYQYELLPLPIARLQVLLSQGGVDLALMMSQTEERDKTAVLASPITNAIFLLVTKHDELPNNGELSHWRIGGLRGSSFLEYARVDLKANAIATSSWNSGLSMLHHDRLDGMILGDVIIKNDIDVSLLQGLNTFSIKEEFGSIYTSRKLAKYESVHKQVEDAIQVCARNGWQK